MDIGGRSGEMEVFARVAEQGSLSGAARVLGLTPSSISRIITRTERRIGTRLLLRTTRAITLTAEGEAYLRGARRILADMAEVEDAITDQGAPRGRLRVSAALAHGRLLIVPLIAAFSARYPAIVVDLRLGDEVVDILGGQADVAIRFGPLADSPLTARHIGSTGQVIVASPDYLARHGTPRVPQDLLNHNCLRFNFRRATPDWPFRLDGRDFSLKVAGTIEGNSGEALSQFARLGAGIARIGAFSVADDLEHGHLVPLLEAYNPGDAEPIHAVFVGGASMPARVRAFIDFLVEHHPA
ncbi:LysR family transcriptional regulator [Pseudomonas yamanorum]|uniref:LysR family transcriptional regulator n=1 Tax=Pseudomonas yamanorum TaxID=515393 RepID=A0A7Y8K3P6_9PSED|nr:MULTISPECIES: LysR substrate-binding domain-containing protein [Pseudomonas]MCS3418659.1 DNA-binding transcriptional LysR family regulator [Pseudomonas sp. BIGb0558]MCS3438379.1 DNA-binding transcriptional LysR family regulator [Pseudomonas sp. BIGb0450]NVZ81246.1 LysR family transcriptional regulator [Pseudomonas yamanorum]NWE39065.1 LysR family transcriptional regulator [Pseudomonas yamanorum]NWE74907.1 LysR family transcriptional regulator [Pseudomonas yamanorum]